MQACQAAEKYTCGAVAEAEATLSPSGKLVALHLLWDLDGTLLDTCPASDGALQNALMVLGHFIKLPGPVPLTRVTLGQAGQMLATRLELEEDALRQTHAQAEAARAGPGAGDAPGHVKGQA